jgi:uncharacterized membrane protein
MSAVDNRTGRHRHRGPAPPAEAGAVAVHGHGHGHEPGPPASHRVRRLLAAVLIPVVLATLVGLWLTWPGDSPSRDIDVGFGQRPVQGQVLATSSAPCTSGSAAPAGQAKKCISLNVLLTNGDSPGVMIQQVLPDEPSTPRFSVNDHVVLAYTGGNPSESESYQIQDFQRGTSMLWLVALFAAAVLLLGRWRGLASLVALYLTHGFSAQTSSAVLGTVLSLGLIGVLGTAFSAATQLTGLNDDTAKLIGFLGHGIDARGLLLAGMVIGALGVLDDVTVTQTSAVWELRRANPELGVRALYTAALRIGRDHISSAVNTLVLAYTGAALPILLIFSLSGQGFGTMVTTQDIAQEVVRTLVGSIGLVAAVPITTAIAALVACQDKIEPISQGVGWESS